MVADMFDPEEQQHAVLWASFWYVHLNNFRGRSAALTLCRSCLGSVIGGICGGPVEQYLSWHWNFYIQLIFGIIVQVVHFFTVPETRATVMLDKKAKKMRKENGVNVYGPNGSKSIKQRLSWKEVKKTMWRPYHSKLHLMSMEGVSDQVQCSSSSPSYSSSRFSAVSATP